MRQQIQIHTDEELTHFCTLPGLPPLNPETISRHNADAHWMLADSAGEIIARCSLWWQSTPPYPGQRLGLIGHYGTNNAEAAAQLLQLACDQLAAHGCTIAVGPMDGNTWQQYRLITERNGEPPFFLEPDNPDDWPGHFRDNGFTVLAQYFSTTAPYLSQYRLEYDRRLAKVVERAAARGIKIRPLRVDCFEAELCQIYNIILASFSRNFLYTPIGQADFRAMYYPLRPYIQPELILIAEQEGHPIGFIFALPDLLQAQSRSEHPQMRTTIANSAPQLRMLRSALQTQAKSSTFGPRDCRQTIDTIIIKTVAVHPDYQTMGLGSLLVARCQEIARDRGYKRAIHALMHETNDSRKISRRNETRTIRRYALFARGLTDEYR